MLNITIVDSDKIAHDLRVETGVTLMEVAKAAAVAGIDGDCGGNCACGTCAVSLSMAQWSFLLDDKSEAERDMLEFTVENPAACRLACQIRLDPDMDGLTVAVATAS